MQSIVIAIDQPLRERIEEAWGEIKAIFNLKQLAGQTEPRIVLHAAEAYGGDAGSAIGRVAAGTRVFNVPCAATRILRGPRHLIYAPIETSAAIEALHAAVLSAIDPHAEGPRAAYAPETWAPHLTLAMGHIDDAIVPDLQQFLSLRDWRWELPVTNICLVPDERSRTAMWTRWELAGAQ